LALKNIGVEGGEVITTPMTFVSSNHAILYNNADPVFCDIEPDTLNIDPEKIEPLVTEKTRAIMVVHYGGYACDMDSIMAIAQHYDIPVIEDAAHACGGEYKGKKLGSIGDMAAFSFHAVKNLATGDGGMITTNNKAACERIKRLRWMGISKDTYSREDQESHQYSWYYNVEEVGYKYHMNDIQAAIGIVQLGKLENANRRRKEIVDAYNEAFRDLAWVEIPVKKAYMTQPAYHNYVIKCVERDALNTYLNDQQISTSVHYIPNNHYEIYQHCRGQTPVADRVWRNLLTLPLFPDLTDEDVASIITAVKKFNKQAA
jgi:perosamine synthetase